jgi:hypothetical protein
VKDSNHQVELYHTLNILLEEPDKDTFKNQIRAFMKLWETTEPDFIKYFNTYYASRAEKWALCYRAYDHGDTDTNMYVER